MGSRVEAPLAAAADGILSGEEFGAARLNELRQNVDFAPRYRLKPSALIDAVIVDLQLLDIKSEGVFKPESLDFLDFNAALVTALSADPNNSFLWFVNYWIKRVRNVDLDGGNKSLSMSYAMGPNEAWIAQRRNPFAFSGLASLPPDLAEQAFSEFVRLVQARLYLDAVNILAGPGWPVHEKLLASLAPLDEAHRNAMARELFNKDLDGVTVPGVRIDRPPRPF
jgi:hypothetical protein